MQYIVIDRQDAYETSVSIYDDLGKVCECLDRKDNIDDIEVYEVSRKVSLKKRVSVVPDEAV